MNYFENKHFNVHAIIYRKKYLDWAASNFEGPKPVMHNDMASMIISVANNLTRNYRFSQYSFHDDMVSDATFACFRYIHGWNPDYRLQTKIADMSWDQVYDIIEEIRTEYNKENLSPDALAIRDFPSFAYVNRICWQEFTNRIMYERKHERVRTALIMDIGIDTILAEMGENEFKMDSELERQVMEFINDHRVLENTDAAVTHRKLSGEIAAAENHIKSMDATQPDLDWLGCGDYGIHLFNKNNPVPEL